MKTITTMVICIGLFILTIGLAIGFGSVELRLLDIYKVIINNVTGVNLFEQTWNDALGNIVWNIRLPRVLLASVIGGGLALSGLLMQCATKNILADPYTLGVSAGASTGAVTVLSLFSVGISVEIGAFLGAMISSGMVFMLANKRGSISIIRLILTGVAVSAFFNAVTNYLIFSTNNSRTAQTALYWMTGSLSGAKWKQVPICLGVLLCSLVSSMMMSKQLDTMLLGESVAVTMGVNVPLFKIIIIGIITLLTGTMVAYSGPIGFVGLIIPHIVRSILGTSIHRYIIPVSLIIGSITLVWSDVLARTLVPPQEIPLGIITAFIGTPFFIVMLRKGSYSFGGSHD